MPIDTKHDDLNSLRIDRSHRGNFEGEPPTWAKRFILGGVGIVLLLGLVALAYRFLAAAAPA